MSDEITPGYMKAIAAVAKDVGLDNCAQCIAVGAAALERCAELTAEVIPDFERQIEAMARSLQDANEVACEAEKDCAKLEERCAELEWILEEADEAIVHLDHGVCARDYGGVCCWDKAIKEARARHAARQQPGDAGESKGDKR